MSEKIIQAVKAAGAVIVESSSLNWTRDFQLTKEQAEMISDPEWVYENLIILGHVVVIAAEPNGGKTTLLMHVAGEIAKRNYSVFYVNADISGGEAKQMRDAAESKGINLLLPDLSGKSMSEIVNQLYKMNKPGANFSGQVFIFDTLKKMTDVINKSQSKELYSLLRSLSAKGLTIILLAHTNKYKDAECQRQSNFDPPFGKVKLTHPWGLSVFLLVRHRSDAGGCLSFQSITVARDLHNVGVMQQSIK